MAHSPLRLECDYEFSRAIVWDALSDADLVSGWLGEATIAPQLGGEYTVRWAHPPTRPESSGRIVALREPEHLEVAFVDGSAVRFDLDELPIGIRGSSTHLRVTVRLAGHESRATASADWMTALDQLEDLLRGHPVDWARWDRDRGAAWAKHLNELGDSTA